MDKRNNRVLVCVVAALLLVLSVWSWVKEPTLFSESERRVLAAAPNFTLETVSNGSFMKDFETYTADQFPLRDQFRTLKAVTALHVLQQKDNNDLYLSQGHVSKLSYPLNEAMLVHAANRFQYLYDNYLEPGGAKVYFSIVPDKNYFLAEPNGYLSLDYEQLIDSMREKTSYMEYIDITDLLSLEDYYYTDTHWRQENIPDVADRIASAMGIDLTQEYEQKTLDVPFYGVYTGQSALPLEPDTIRYLTNDILEHCVVTSYDTGMPKESQMYNRDKAQGRDPYEFFLSGSDALMTVENPNASTDRELIVFRDSFGSSLVPLLAEGYAKITLVDIRYVQSAFLGNLVDFADQDVLFLYSTMLLNDSLALR